MAEFKQQLKERLQRGAILFDHFQSDSMKDGCADSQSESVLIRSLISGTFSDKLTLQKGLKMLVSHCSRPLLFKPIDGILKTLLR